MLDKIKENLDQWCDFSKKNGANFYLLIGPNKSTIYPEKMSRGLYITENDSFFDSIKKIKYTCKFTIIDVRDTLLNNKDKKLYYKWGTHWNDLAGMLVWDRVKYEIEKNQPYVKWPTPPSVELVQRKARSNEDSAWAWFGQTDPSVESVPEVHYSLTEKQMGVRKYTEIKIFAIGDSFLQFMTNAAKTVFPEYIAVSNDSGQIRYDEFDKNSYAWLIKAYGVSLNIDAISMYRPNVVMLEVVERNLHTLGSLERPQSEGSINIKDILGDWKCNGMPTKIELKENNLTVINERGEKANAEFINGNIFVSAWGVTGLISNGSKRLKWQNGVVWNR